MWLDEEDLDLRFIIHDNDSKFSAGFDAVFEANGARIAKTPLLSPIADAIAESWIGTLKQECLNQFLGFNPCHLDHIVQTWISYYDTFRPHQSLGNVPLGQGSRPPPEGVTNQDVGPVRRHADLAGLLNHYGRKAV